MLENSKSVVLALVTEYKRDKDAKGENKDETRIELAKKTIASAVKNGHIVVVIDGSKEHETFKRDFKELGKEGEVLVFPQIGNSLGAAKRQSYLAAQELAKHKGCAAVLACEPEKDLSEWISELVKPIVEEKKHIVVPARDKDGWKKYPEFQKKSEQAGNDLFEKILGEEFKRIIGKKLDIFFGPILFSPSPEVTRCFLDCHPERFVFPDTYVQMLGVIKALKDGYDPESIKVKFRYPDAQRQEEEGSQDFKEKRIKQFITCTAGFQGAVSHFRSEKFKSSLGR